MSEDETPDDKPQGRAAGWELERTERPFTTPWMSLRRDQGRLQGDHPFAYIYVEAAPAVFVVPVTRSGEIILIRQYRYTVDEWCLEVPAGGTWDRPGESLITVARTELREEIGGSCRDIRHVAAFYPWSSRSDQVAYVFLALDVELDTSPGHERTEQIELKPVPASEALRMARRGEIVDGQSALSLLLCETFLRDMGYLGERDRAT